ncbi:MAG: FtsX-like permease family protein, partial [Armatimonadetes bacterium]|nr:FtsX-like permease family protein [Armatimonadota bacterium]
MNPFLLTKVSLRHLVREPLRTLLILFGIALGVAVFVSIRIANVSALAAFRSTLTVVSGPANLLVRGASRPVPDEIFPKVWRLPGVKGAAPRVEATVSLAETTTDNPALPGDSLLILGIDPFTQADLEPVELRPPSEPQDRDAGPAPDTRFFTEPNGILLTQSFAERHGLSPGETFPITVSGVVKPLLVLDVLPPGDLSNAYGGDVGVMDLANAQELLNRVGRLDRIDLLTAPEDEERVAAAIREMLPPGVSVGPPSARMRQAESMVSAFQLNLTALSLISALVGVFIIYNALLISVLKRRREIATLRSVGVTRGGIMALFLAEAAALGVAGSALGLALGAWLARLTLGAVSQTISVLYLRVQARELTITPETLAMGAVLGVGSALAAGLAPALEAAGTSPAEVLRQATAARPARQRAGPWFLWGLALLVLAGISSITPGLRESRLMGFAGAFALLLGVALMTPAFIVALGPVTQSLYLRLFGVKGELAAHEVRAALDRSAAVIAALGVAVAMTVGLAIMVGSFRRTVEIWVDQSLRADLFIGPAGQAVS